MAAIGVFCASSSTLDPKWLDLATRTGAELAARGHSLVSGGGCVGMMGAVADGTRAGGGHTLGVIPQSLVDLEVADTASDELFEVWTTATLDLHDKPIVLLDPDGFYDGLTAWLGQLSDTGFVRAAALDRVIVAKSVASALDAIEHHLGSR